MIELETLKSELEIIDTRRNEILKLMESQREAMIENLSDIIGHNEDAFRVLVAELSDLAIQRFGLAVIVRRPRRANEPKVFDAAEAPV